MVHNVKLFSNVEGHPGKYIIEISKEDFESIAHNQDELRTETALCVNKVIQFTHNGKKKKCLILKMTDLSLRKNLYYEDDLNYAFLVEETKNGKYDFNNLDVLEEKQSKSIDPEKIIKEHKRKREEKRKKLDELVRMRKMAEAEAEAGAHVTEPSLTSKEEVGPDVVGSVSSGTGNRLYLASSGLGVSAGLNYHLAGDSKDYDYSDDYFEIYNGGSGSGNKKYFFILKPKAVGIIKEHFKSHNNVTISFCSISKSELTRKCNAANAEGSSVELHKIDPRLISISIPKAQWDKTKGTNITLVSTIDVGHNGQVIWNVKALNPGKKKKTDIDKQFLSLKKQRRQLIESGLFKVYSEEEMLKISEADQSVVASAQLSSKKKPKNPKRRRTEKSESSIQLIQLKPEDTEALTTYKDKETSEKLYLEIEISDDNSHISSVNLISERKAQKKRANRVIEINRNNIDSIKLDLGSVLIEFNPERDRYYISDFGQIKNLVGYASSVAAEHSGRSFEAPEKQEELTRNRALKRLSKEFETSDHETRSRALRKYIISLDYVRVEAMLYLYHFDLARDLIVRPERIGNGETEKKILEDYRNNPFHLYEFTSIIGLTHQLSPEDSINLLEVFKVLVKFGAFPYPLSLPKKLEFYDNTNANLGDLQLSRDTYINLSSLPKDFERIRIKKEEYKKSKNVKFYDVRFLILRFAIENRQDVQSYKYEEHLEAIAYLCSLGDKKYLSPIADAIVIAIKTQNLEFLRKHFEILVSLGRKDLNFDNLEGYCEKSFVEIAMEEEAGDEIILFLLRQENKSKEVFFRDFETVFSHALTIYSASLESGEEREEIEEGNFNETFLLYRDREGDSLINRLMNLILQDGTIDSEYLINILCDLSKLASSPSLNVAKKKIIIQICRNDGNVEELSNILKDCYEDGKIGLDDLTEYLGYIITFQHKLITYSDSKIKSNEDEASIRARREEYLRQDTQDLRDEILRREDELSRLRSENNRLSSRLGQKTKREKTLVEKTKEVEKSREAIVLEVRRLELEDKLNKESLAKKIEEIESLKARLREQNIKKEEQIRGIVQRYEKQSDEGNALISINEELSKKIQELEEEIESLKQQIRDLKSSTKQRKIKDLSLTKALSQRESEIEEYKRKEEELRSKIAAYEEQISVISSERNRLSKNLSKAKAGNREYHTKKLNLEQTIRDLTHKIQHLEYQIVLLNQANKSKKLDLKQQTKDIVDLLTRRIEDLKKHNRILESEIEGRQYWGRPNTNIVPRLHSKPMMWRSESKEDQEMEEMNQYILSLDGSESSKVNFPNFLRSKIERLFKKYDDNISIIVKGSIAYQTAESLSLKRPSDLDLEVIIRDLYSFDNEEILALIGDIFGFNNYHQIEGQDIYENDREQRLSIYRSEDGRDFTVKFEDERRKIDVTFYDKEKQPLNKLGWISSVEKRILLLQNGSCRIIKARGYGNDGNDRENFIGNDFPHLKYEDSLVRINPDARFLILRSCFLWTINMLEDKDIAFLKTKGSDESIRGEPIEILARELGISAEDLQELDEEEQKIYMRNKIENVMEKHLLPYNLRRNYITNLFDIVANDNYQGHEIYQMLYNVVQEMQIEQNEFMSESVREIYREEDADELQEGTIPKPEAKPISSVMSKASKVLLDQKPKMLPPSKTMKPLQRQARQTPVNLGFSGASRGTHHNFDK